MVFWAIFYQQNSTWVQQGDQMDCYLGSLHVPPGKMHTHTHTNAQYLHMSPDFPLSLATDLMPSINDLLVVIIIPFLDYLVCPHIERSMGIQVKPMHKVSADNSLLQCVCGYRNVLASCFHCIVSYLSMVVNILVCWHSDMYSSSLWPERMASVISCWTCHYMITGNHMMIA